MKTLSRVMALAVVVLAAAVLAVAGGVASLGPQSSLGGLGAIVPDLVPSGPPTGAATSEISQPMLALYERAAPTCPGLSWSLLAAIGTVESSNGTSDLPGVHSGANYAGAMGPMQFEPSTFAEYDEPVPPGGAEPPSPYDPVDAVYAAARLLCANGAAGGRDVEAAVFAYNHSKSYVDEVLSLAARYATGG